MREGSVDVSFFFEETTDRVDYCFLTRPQHRQWSEEFFRYLRTSLHVHHGSIVGTPLRPRLLKRGSNDTLILMD